jgi:glucan phosphoethanolaminetransferase (alkaline phosphatase superfamily)
LKTDEKLLDLVKDFAWQEKQFLVLHLRHAHSPYSEFSQKKTGGKDRFEQTVLAYKAVMRYHDFWLKRLFLLLPKDVQVIFVSDHGEMLGPNLYGHAFEHPEVHKIPVWTYPRIPIPKTHEDIALTLAKWFGVRVKKS